MIKAVFFDIDGTLVSFKTHQVPGSAVRAINSLREKGILVFIVTIQASIIKHTPIARTSLVPVQIGMFLL